MGERVRPLEAAAVPPRVLGSVRGPRPGPTLLCVAGLHGNEPAGVEAVRRVLRAVERRAGEVSGEVLGLAGNVAALAAGRRFLLRDLNRAWTEERVAWLRGRDAALPSAEDREQARLLAAIDEVVERARGPVHVLDLHTTSGAGGAFTTFADALPNRRFAALLPVPMVLGLEELVDGTLLSYLGDAGLVAVAFESGRHDEPEAVARAEAAIWIAAAGLGLLPRRGTPAAERGRERLRRESRHLPGALEMRHRHPVRPGDGFRMRPGYRSFQPVGARDVLARDRSGDVVAGESGRVLMPLYQEQGSDGFFIVRAFSPFWLRASTVLRVLKVDRVARWLPGVRADPADPDCVLVDRRIARWFALELFHLLGFRKVDEAGERLRMRRRPFDRVGAGRRDRRVVRGG